MKMLMKEANGIETMHSRAGARVLSFKLGSPQTT